MKTKMTSEVYIRPLELGDVDALLDLRIRNRDFLTPFEPHHTEEFYTREGQTRMIEQSIHNWTNDGGYGFGIFRTAGGELVGRVNLSNVSRGAWQSCTLGYFLDQIHNGKGWVTQAVRQVLQVAFEELGLHRVQAAIMPKNAPSIRVVEKLGFRYVGLDEYYLKINGAWEHHQIYSMTREHYELT